MKLDNQTIVCGFQKKTTAGIVCGERLRQF